MLAKLFVDSEGQLTLLTWPVPARFEDPEPPMRQEVLLSNVEDVKFWLYRAIPRDKKGLETNPEAKTGEYNQWFSEWPVEERELPALLKIVVVIKGKEEPVVYAFMLPNASEHIFYP